MYDHDRTDEEIWSVLRDDMPSDRAYKEGDSGKTAVDKKDEFEPVGLPVPTEEIEAGTLLTKELIESKFVMVKIVPPAPTNVIADIREYAGQYVLKTLCPEPVRAQVVPRRPPPPHGKGAAPDEAAVTEVRPAVRAGGRPPLPRRCTTT